MTIEIKEINYLGVNFCALDDWRDIPTFLEQHPQFTKGQIEGLTRPFNRAVNGLDGAVKLIGRKLYIHVPAFSIWMSQQDDPRVVGVLDNEKRIPPKEVAAERSL